MSLLQNEPTDGGRSSDERKAALGGAPMLKLYCEHPEFDEFAGFHTESGLLFTLTKSQFLTHFSSNDQLQEGPLPAWKGPVRPGVSAFVGDTKASRTRFPRRVY